MLNVEIYGGEWENFSEAYSPLKTDWRNEAMIVIENKYDVGQEVYYIGRKCNQYGKKKKFVWKVKSREPVKILCIFYKHKLFGDSELAYNIERYGKVREGYLFSNYESAYAECNKRNKMEEEVRMQQQIGGMN